MEFCYAHKNTSDGERSTPTAQFNGIVLPEELEKISKSAAEREIPVSDRETLSFLSTITAAVKPKRILELGTAVGLSAAVMLYACPASTLVTVERDANFYGESVKNFKDLGLTSRVSSVLGDAQTYINSTDESFDFIFLDCAKAQYIKLLPRLKQILKQGGTLLADDVLLFGYTSGETPVPPKRKMLVKHIEEYIFAVINDKELITTVIGTGNGLAMSVKK